MAAPAVATAISRRSELFRFDFFSSTPFVPDQLAGKLPYLRDAERVQVAPNTLTCRVDRGGPVLVSFFGRLGLRQVAAHDETRDTGLRVASLLDIAGTKAAVVQKRAEVKDYLDMDALLRHGVDLPTLPADVQARLSAAVAAVDVTKLPALTPYVKRPDNGLMP